MELEAAADDLHERGTVATIHRQEPTRHAGCSTRDRGPLDDHDIRAARRETIGDGGADSAYPRDNRSQRFSLLLG